ncbi:MAG: CPBP family intramembrane metalloprotease, partial [Saprospiraceae bacterium]|nr:CPBP family intramembrane metalloprotease [Saprospiraceae bacterium]
TGLLMFSALPLILITLVFWWIFRLSKDEFGLIFGPLKYYGLALLYPAIVLGATALLAYIFKDFCTIGIDWSKTRFNITMASTIGIIMVLLTEEGFFRGWLWGALRKCGLKQISTLYVTSAIFVLWHISAVTSGTEYGLPMGQVPVYLVNATLLGLIWGSMRSLSGSVIVPSVSHAVWNGFAYELFGFGEKMGALGISDTAFFGPEVGYLGIVLNGLFFLWLRRMQINQNKKGDL